MTALSRLPCPQCGALNLAQDLMCLGCGCRFTKRPLPAAAPVVQYAPDEMCTRCFGVLLPAARFDTANTLGGIETRSGSPMGGMTGRELSGALWLLDFLTNLLVGGIIAKNFDRRLRLALKESPNSLCCPSCRSIVRR